MHQLVQEAALQQARTDRHINRSLVMFGIAIVLWVAMTVWLQQRTEQRIKEALPPVVNLSVIPEVRNPTVCPGDSIAYTLHADVQNESVVEIDTVIFNADTGRTEVQSNTIRTVYAVGEIHLQTQWRVFDKLPATTVMPERPWRAGNYQRILAVTGIEGEQQSSIARMDFVIGADCPNLAK